jgi:hypothetical protein
MEGVNEKLALSLDEIIAQQKKKATGRNAKKAPVRGICVQPAMK